MTRFLGFDWDAEKLHVIEVEQRGGTFVVERALSWPAPFPGSVAAAEAAGQRLSELLHEAGITASSVLACIGRDRVICKDVRYPDVRAEEVAALVRFQVIKELTLPPENAIIDYALCSVPWPGGEKRALSVVLPKEHLTILQRACQSAGLKLLCLTPRPFGVAAYQLTVNGDNGATRAACVLINGKGELVVARGGEVVFSRSISGSEAGTSQVSLSALQPEIHRSLSAYAGQYPRHPVQTLQVAGPTSAAELAALQQALQVPIEPLPAPKGVKPEVWGPCVGILGLIQSRINRQPARVDFLAPKEPPPPVNRKKQYLLAAAGCVLFVGLALGTLYHQAEASRQGQLEVLQARNADLQKQIKTFGDLDKRLDAVNGWANSEIVVLDELYDLIARFPDRPGLRVTRVAWTPLVQANAIPERTNGTAKGSATNGAAAKVVGKITLEAIGDSADALEQLRRALESAKHWKMELWERDTPGPSQIRATLQVIRHEPADYQLLLGSLKNTTTEERRGPPRGKGSGKGGRP